MSLFSNFFTTPSLFNFMILAYGWSLATNRHTITSYLWPSGAVSYKHFSRFYLFLSGPFFQVLKQLWSGIILFAAQRVPEDQPIRIKVDDLIKKKSGRKIQGASRYRNAAGSARQEYRVLWGLNFVYATMQIPLGYWPGHFLSIPIGLKIYLKESLARKLRQPYRSRSLLAREMVDLAAELLPNRALRVCADGGYASKGFLRNLLKNVQVVSRFPVNRKLYALPQTPEKGRRGRKPKKGKLIGSPKTLINDPRGWRDHPTEEGAFIKTFTGIWHSVLPGVPIQVVMVWRKDFQQLHPQSPKRLLEAFFTTDRTLSFEEILNEYHDRWGIEIDIRDANAYYGLGQDQCRNYQRIVGVNNFRMIMAAARTLWFIKQLEHAQEFDLLRYRPWYQQKCSPSQLDVISACQEALYYQGISPTIRFIQDMSEIYQDKDKPVPKAA